jgi:hypothetical protein
METIYKTLIKSEQLNQVWLLIESSTLRMFNLQMAFLTKISFLINLLD